MQYGLIHYNAPGDTLEEFLDFAADAGFDSGPRPSADEEPVLRSQFADRPVVARMLHEFLNRLLTL